MPLRADAVAFSYPRAGGRPVLQGTTMELPYGAVTAILGPNGAGKSTLLRLLLSVLKPSSGSVTLDGAPLARLPARARAARIAYIPQRSDLAAPFTVGQVVRLGRFALGPSEPAVLEALASLRLRALEGELFGTLSTGQQQRVTLARVLCQLWRSPAQSTQGPAGQTILADEPCSAMDPQHALHAMGLLREQAAAGRAVAVVLHDLTVALRFADRAVLLDADGRVAASGPAEEVLEPAILERVFSVPFDRYGPKSAELGGPGEGALVPRAAARYHAAGAPPREQ